MDARRLEELRATLRGAGVPEEQLSDTELEALVRRMLKQAVAGARLRQGIDLERVVGWLRALAGARSTAHRAIAGGECFANSDFPDAHDHNFAWLDSASALSEAEAFFVEHGIANRLLEAREELAPDLTTALLGYVCSTEVLMAWAGGDITPGDFLVERLEVSERCTVAEEGWRGLVSDDEARHLGRRAETMVGACKATFLGIRDETGRVVSRLDLYEHDGLSQLEELITDPAHERRGMGTALLREGLRRASDNAVFLVAADGSAPAAMYQRLGFEAIGRTVSFTRS